MKLFIYSKYSATIEQKRQLNAFRRLVFYRYEPEYYFVLYENPGIVVAECEVYQQKRPFFYSWFSSSKTRKFEITDVFVAQPYRGNQYCSLLLLNVMYYFDQHIQANNDDTTPDMVFELFTHHLNHSARRAYRKIFGKESGRFEKLIYFSTEKH